MLVENEQGKVFSIEKVDDELKAVNDELATWAAARAGDFFLELPLDVPPALTEVSHWVTAQTYAPPAVNRFLQDADYYLIAHALVCGHQVVTHEKPSNSRKKIKIPDVCIGLGVKWTTPFEMLSQERARFVLCP